MDCGLRESKVFVYLDCRQNELFTDEVPIRALARTDAGRVGLMNCHRCALSPMLGRTVLTCFINWKKR
jgi:hypothetical protein